MRLKTYSAENLNKAIAKVRAELGADAIIVSSQSAPGKDRVIVTAALDTEDDFEIFTKELPRGDEASDLGDVIRALNYHGTPIGLTDRLLDAMWEANTEDPVLALAASLDQELRFKPLFEESDRRPLMLVGPPGSGKTVSLAKLAARETLAGRQVDVITTDTVKAGGVEQLAAFTNILDCPLRPAEGGAALANALAECRVGARVLIDSAGTNPFDGGALSELATLAASADANLAVVLAAGGDPIEAAEIASAFLDINAGRLIYTRVDGVHRLGALLAAGAPPMAISEVGIGPHIAEGLTQVNPVSLARLLLRRTTNGKSIYLPTEAQA